MYASRRLATVLALALPALSACAKHHLPRANGGDRAGAPRGQARDGKLPADGPACLVAQIDAEIAVADDVADVDVLFVIDNSGQMAEEQDLLLQQFPRLLRELTESAEHPGIDSLHLGVVSSDLGLVGISDIDMCADLGDDGILQSEPRRENCPPSLPRFLTYDEGIHDPLDVALNLACIAQLGSTGCGFEQPLEAGLKALWPAKDDRITFLPNVNGFGAQGKGDAENAGFLRSDPLDPLSLIAIVVVSDEDDCSSMDTAHLRPSTLLDPGKPADAELLQQGLNVRCNLNPEHLFPPERYVNALRALRPGNENLVMFAALVGVPPETVNDDVLDGLQLEDPVARDAFYRNILDHPLMQPVVDDNGTPDPADDTMHPSCTTARGLAFPPRRIVEVARGFGENGLVQSICESDFGSAINNIAALINRRLGAVCLPRPLVRKDDGLVACDVIWELPPDPAAAGTSGQCRLLDRPFTVPPAEGEPTHTARGGQRCRVAQLAVREDGQLSSTVVDSVQQIDGWFYDDFSDETRRCLTVPAQRIAFTPGAAPPQGTTVKLECLDADLVGTEGRDDDGGDECSAGSHSAESKRVGDPCTPATPEDGFDPREVYVATAAEQCGGGVCVVDRLDGDPAPGCRPSEVRKCATRAEAERALYCSCRCDAPEGYAQCACPDGFGCVSVLTQGSDDLRGGYCLRAQ